MVFQGRLALTQFPELQGGLSAPKNRTAGMILGANHARLNSVKNDLPIKLKLATHNSYEEIITCKQTCSD